MKFTLRQKRLAYSTSNYKLKQLYERSEVKLDRAARRGDFKGIDRAMKKHQTYEYAMLYKKAKRARYMRRYK